MALALIAMYLVAARDDGAQVDQAIAGTEGLVALIPERGANIPLQSDVGAKLSPGYRGRLAINGKAIPSTHLLRDLDNPVGEVITRPGIEGTDESGERTLPPVFNRLDADQNCATITLWNIDSPRDTNTVQWCFTVG